MLINFLFLKIYNNKKDMLRYSPHRFNCLRCVQVHVIFTLTYNGNIQRYLSLLKQLKYNLLSKTLLKEFQ